MLLNASSTFDSVKLSEQHCIHRICRNVNNTCIILKNTSLELGCP